MAGIRVGLYMPIQPGGHIGGVEQFLIGLVDGLGGMTDDEYIVVTHPADSDWVRPFGNENVTVVPRPWRGVAERTKDALGPLGETLKPVAKPFLEVIRGQQPATRSGELSETNDFLDSLDVDVVHFPTQNYEPTAHPSIYNPHDIQHEHYPEFFSEDELARRRRQYRQGCEAADAVDVPSQFVKQDLVEQYDVDTEKVYVIPRGAPVDVYDRPTNREIEATRRSYDLPDTFAFFPAKSWPHKNHVRLVDAIARVRDTYGHRIDLVCTGHQSDHWDEIEARIAAHDLADQVHWLGYVSQTELRALYELATFVVNPSLFEGGGFPLLEAWSEGVPVACADATALAEKAGDAALLFDPTDVNAIADALLQMATDEALRMSLIERGRDAVAGHDWQTTATAYRLLYRHVAGAPLTDDEEATLERARSGEL